VVAYFEAKADLFGRLADDADEEPLVRQSLLDSAARARRNAELVRAEAADWRWL